MLGQLPENFHELPRAERLRLAREVIGTAWDVQPTTPFVAEKGKNQGLLLDVLSETVADIRPVPAAAPRYRSVPVPDGSISTVDDAQRLFSLDSKGGYVHTAPTREGALNFTPGSQSRAVFVYPEGTPAFVVNGEGQVFSGARELQASIDPKRFQTFANNDWGVVPRDLRVGRVSPDPDGTVMIYLEPKPAPKTTTGAAASSSAAATSVVGSARAEAQALFTVELMQERLSNLGRPTYREVLMGQGNSAPQGMDPRILDLRVMTPEDVRFFQQELFIDPRGRLVNGTWVPENGFSVGIQARDARGNNPGRLELNIDSSHQTPFPHAHVEFYQNGNKSGRSTHKVIPGGDFRHRLPVITPP
ncbi:hypothetical protein EBR78_10630 [bacterium]|nr:hypothetical protein [bacterium]